MGSFEWETKKWTFSRPRPKLSMRWLEKTLTRSLLSNVHKITFFCLWPQNCQYPPASGGFRLTNGHESIELVENRSQSPSPPGMVISHPHDQPLRGQCRESRSSSVILRRLSVNVTGSFRSQKKTFLKKQARSSSLPFSWHLYFSKPQDLAVSLPSELIIQISI